MDRTNRTIVVLYVREFLNENFRNDKHISYFKSRETPMSLVSVVEFVKQIYISFTIQ